MSYSLPPSVVKSNYKFHCPGCSKPISRGDSVTFVSESKGMILRPVICKSGCYIPYTGRRIVHKDCDLIGLWTSYDSNQESKTKTNINYDYCEFDFDTEINKDSNYDYCDNGVNNQDTNEKEKEKDTNESKSNESKSKGWFW